MWCTKCCFDHQTWHELDKTNHSSCIL
jgi:hypothetical protein